mgnify:CR=1 FL=1|jgi:hypothetical protein
MIHLPLDMLREIASYTTVCELAQLRLVSRDFNMVDIQRQKRFEWCMASLRGMNRSYSQGSCVDCMCDHMKAVCITIGDEEFEEPRTQTLSNYCSQHARQYYGVEVNDLIDFVYTS